MIPIVFDKDPHRYMLDCLKHGQPIAPGPPRNGRRQICWRWPARAILP